jgi:GTP-binding protein HflX
MPFATLDTRTRQWRLPDGRLVLLSDTVGFLQRLPHHLVASFHATLEEALNVELLVHVVDAAHPDAAVQMGAVDGTLRGLTSRTPEILVLNKLDRLVDPLLLHPLVQRRAEEIVFASARTGEGFERLAAVVAARLDARSTVVDALLSTADGRSISTAKAAGQLLEERLESDQCLRLRLRVLDGALGALQRTLGERARFEIVQPAAEPFLRGADC